jgi:hypothetical protein
MAHFDLAVEGLARLRRTHPFGETPIASEPMAGLVDGVNTLFRTRKGPVKTNSITVYVSGVVAPGTFVPPDIMDMTTAPVAQPYATYTHQPLSDLQAKQLLMDGITELESRWPRAWRMSSSTVTFTAATEADANIYVVSGDSMADPSDEVALSTSENQRGLVVACATYVYRMAQAFAASLAAVSIRGTGGGMTLDRKAIPSAMMGMLAMYDKRLRTATIQAMMEWTGGASLGGGISAIATRDYMQQYEWQTSSKLYNWYDTYSFDPSDVDLEAIA